MGEQSSRHLPPQPPRLVGVLGGMGPLATIDFMQKVLNSTRAQRDQDHVPMLVSSIPQIPDRTQAYQGVGDSPLDAMLECGRRLQDGGAGLIVVPCNTAHLWYEELASKLTVPLAHLVDAAIGEAVSLVGPGGRVGLLATDATLASGLYINRPSAGMQWLMPTSSEVADLVTPGIAAVKAGDVSQGTQRLGAAADALIRRGAKGVVMGCTEIPVALHGWPASVPLIDATAALARFVVSWSWGSAADAAASH